MSFLFLTINYKCTFGVRVGLLNPTLFSKTRQNTCIIFSSELLKLFQTSSQMQFRQSLKPSLTSLMGYGSLFSSSRTGILMDGHYFLFCLWCSPKCCIPLFLKRNCFLSNFHHKRIFTFLFLVCKLLCSNLTLKNSVTGRMEDLFALQWTEDLTLRIRIKKQ